MKKNIGVIDLKYIGKEVKDVIYLSVEIYDDNLKLIDSIVRYIRPINNTKVNSFDIIKLEKFNISLTRLEDSNFFGSIHDEVLDFLSKYSNTSFFIQSKSKKDILKNYLKAYNSDVFILNAINNTQVVSKVGKELLLRFNIHLKDKDVVSALKNLYGMQDESNIVFLINKILNKSKFKNTNIIKYYKNIDLYNSNTRYNFNYEAIPGEIKYGLKKLLESTEFHIVENDIYKIQLNKKKIDYKKYQISTIYNSKYSDTSLSVSLRKDNINISNCNIVEYRLNLEFKFIKNEDFLSIYIPFNNSNINSINLFIKKNEQYKKVFKNRA